MCAKSKSEKRIPKSVREIKTVQNLGSANAWTKIPELVRHCRLLGHRVTQRKIDRCYHEYSCNICNYTYTVDSGD